MPAQLSLFADADPPPVADAPVGRRKRASTTPRPHRAREGQGAYDLFDPPISEAPTHSSAESTVPAEAPHEIIEAPEEAEEDDAIAEADQTAAAFDDAGRIRFDPTVWHLRPESGDFIQIRTGEIRQEDDFIFALPGANGSLAMPDEWDMPQDESPADG